MDIFRVTALWTGFAGAPGYSAFHFATGGGLISDATQCVERVEASFELIETLLPDNARVTVESEVEIIASETGEITGFEDVGPRPFVEGSSLEPYSAASGAVVNWRTNDYRFGRRIRGRTFLVPLSGDAYASDGTLANSARTSIQAFANNLVGGDVDSEFGVWSRPRDGAGGVFATATGSSVPDMAAVLRSRRD